MQTVFLNDNYLPIEEARISPMDRGFLFGDGVYEVIPAYAGRFVGLARHIARLNRSLEAIGISLPWPDAKWQQIAQRLMGQTSTQPAETNYGVYIHVSRGADVIRAHAFPTSIRPTVFATCMVMPPEPIPDRQKVKGLRVCTQTDLRWQRCHIKSTSLLGNVLHFQDARTGHYDETLLFNHNDELTEASTSNVFIVEKQHILTPPLDNHLLAGITRGLLIDILREHSELTVLQQPISRQQVYQADEIWLTSSSKAISPVVELDNRAVGAGKPGEVWQQAMQAYSEHKFDY